MDRLNETPDNYLASEESLYNFLDETYLEIMEENLCAMVILNDKHELTFVFVEQWDIMREQ